MKRALFALLGIVVIGVAGYFALNYFKKETIVEPPVTPPPAEAGVSAEVAHVATEAIVAFWDDAATSAMYSVTPLGHIIKIGADDTKEITSQDLLDLKFVLPSPTGAYALFIWGAPGSEMASLFETETMSWSPLGNTTFTAAWNTDGSKIAYGERTASGIALSLLEVKTKKKTALTSLALADIRLLSPNSKELYLFDAPSAFQAGAWWSFNLSTKAMTEKNAPTSGFDLLWNNQTNTGIAFTESGFATHKTAHVDSNGAIVSALPFAGSVRDKCVASGSGFICAVPRSLPEGTRLPDDYFTKKLYTEDDILLWDSGTGKTTTLLSGKTQIFDATNLLVKGSQLFFINRYDQNIYSIPTVK